MKYSSIYKAHTVIDSGYIFLCGIASIFRSKAMLQNRIIISPRECS